MRFTLLAATTFTVAALACGGGSRDAQQTPPPAPPGPPAAPAAAGGAGTVIEIRMTGNGRDKAAFEPSQVTAAPGSTLRFTNVSGGPHNVVFWADSIPQGARDALNNAMPNHQGNLASPMLVQPNATYDIALPADIPHGAYKGYCAPHLMMGMKLTVTVQ
jgi:plastocyanin